MTKSICSLAGKTLLVVLALNLGAKSLGAAAPAPGLEFSTPIAAGPTAAHGPCIPGLLYRIGNPHGPCIGGHLYRIGPVPIDPIQV